MSKRKNFNVYFNGQVVNGTNASTFLHLKNDNLHYYLPVMNSTTLNGFSNINWRPVYLYASGGNIVIDAYNSGSLKRYYAAPASQFNITGENNDGIDINTVAGSDQLVLLDEYIKRVPDFQMYTTWQGNNALNGYFYNTPFTMYARWNLNNPYKGQNYSNTEVYLRGEVTWTVNNASLSSRGKKPTGSISRTCKLNAVLDGFQSPVYIYEYFRRYGYAYECELDRLNRLRHSGWGWVYIWNYIYYTAQYNNVWNTYNRLRNAQTDAAVLSFYWDDIRPIYSTNAITYYFPLFRIGMYSRDGQLLCETYMNSNSWKARTEMFTVTS